MQLMNWRVVRGRPACQFLQRICIAACAKHHGADLEHSDSDFTQLANL